MTEFTVYEKIEEEWLPVGKASFTILPDIIMLYERPYKKVKYIYDTESGIHKLYIREEQEFIL